MLQQLYKHWNNGNIGLKWINKSFAFQVIPLSLSYLFSILFIQYSGSSMFLLVYISSTQFEYDKNI